MGSLRVRFGLLVGSAAALVLLAAGGLFWSLAAAERTLDSTLEAQVRLELIAELSGRLTEYGLAAVEAVGETPSRPERLATARDEVDRALNAVDEGLNRAIARSDAIVDRTQYAARSRPLARLRAARVMLDRQVAQIQREPDPVKRSDAIRGALNAFGAVTGPPLTFLVEAERRGVESAAGEVRALAVRLRALALAVAGLAVVVLLLVHRTLTRPLLRRIDDIRAGAAAIGRGELDTRLPVAAHDELGLLVASFNRMAARLKRRESRVAAARAALEETVAQATAELRAANTRLEEIDRSRRRFFADVSHELRTPLTVILGECDLAARSPDTPEAFRPVIATIRKRALRLHRRVGDMLRIARSESGQIELERKPVSLAAVLTEAVENCASEARRRRIALAFEPSETDVEIQADPEWLRQIVEGLIDNALRHAAGATRVWVVLRARRDGAEVTVADDGPGFPAEAETLFERFRRGGNSSPAQGFGIGLALARWVVERHDGVIRLGSGGDEARGARVTLVLPADAREDAA
ncbi:integral membrane sensor signal transduction histidine kinase [Methylobacterium sp. 4-46]|uniref:sensor histidine kinase n=1 Tax=unclassified Methylobacterium TaxID=2615210 RepID=UPI000152DAA5|nr:MULTISPECIES: ATP-binding protein [Methylobacterium]ACA20049.1 integral membrane sensor signal transduction histidine kinase [Methylobacterium sp. 4-46]WFT79236.1 ATP-binding protein [Methylobacterium nodulans]